MKAGDIVYTHGCYDEGEKFTIVQVFGGGQILCVDDMQGYSVIPEKFLISEEKYENILVEKEDKYAEKIMEMILSEGFKQERIIKILEHKLKTRIMYETIHP